MSGRVLADGTVLSGVGDLAVVVIDKTLFHLTHPTFDAKALQLVSGAPATALEQDPPCTFEVIPSDDPDLVALLAGLAPAPADGVVVRVRDVKGDPVPSGFVVRIEASEGTL